MWRRAFWVLPCRSLCTAFKGTGRSIRAASPICNPPNSKFPRTARAARRRVCEQVPVSAHLRNLVREVSRFFGGGRVEGKSQRRFPRSKKPQDFDYPRYRRKPTHFARILSTGDGRGVPLSCCGRVATRGAAGPPCGRLESPRKRPSCRIRCLTWGFSRIGKVWSPKFARGRSRKRASPLRRAGRYR